MWYNYVNRTIQDCRIWRKTNLRYNQDDLGMTRHKTIGKLTDTIFRLARSQGNIRGTSFFFFIGLGLSLSYIKSEIYDPAYTVPKIKQQKKKQAEFEEEADKKLFKNKVGAPTRPTRSFQDFKIFLNSSKSINEALSFITYEGSIELYEDQEKGLDGVLTDEDKKMMKYYEEALKYKSSH